MKPEKHGPTSNGVKLTLGLLPLMPYAYLGSAESGYGPGWGFLIVLAGAGLATWGGTGYSLETDQLRRALRMREEQVSSLRERLYGPGKSAADEA